MSEAQQNLCARGGRVVKASEELELLVQRIQQELAPNAEVIHNVKMMGCRSKVNRQIDVLVKERIGQYEIKIVIDCKDYKHPVDVKGVEEFYGLLKDVGGHKGVLVCPRGFSEAAKNRASDLQIDLYSPVDTDPHKWQVVPYIPAMVDWRGVAISFGVSCSYPAPFMMPGNFFSSIVAFDEAGNELGNPVQRLLDQWNKGDITTEEGETGELPIFGDTVPWVDNGYGQRIPVRLYANMLVHRQLRYGQLPIRKMSGFKDELKGVVITNAFEVGILDPEEIDREWREIAKEEEAHPQPVLLLRGVTYYDLQMVKDSGVFGF
ncbi:restriction endonuclease [Novosphingobium sp. CCH12-A3]|uniref:restriction endonuclease n=1 Tax=Novosphingobium sp. CCH12-A3 TaxID=1768752 RepID=UPI0018D2120F|nr:restriction endonuclease [Novosphingobium sp. CCH12-A3]